MIRAMPATNGRMSGAEYLAEASAITKQLHRRDVEEAKMRKKRREFWLRANRTGITYPEICRACGVSEAILTREIRRARTETRSETLAARSSRVPSNAVHAGR